MDTIHRICPSSIDTYRMLFVFAFGRQWENLVLSLSLTLQEAAYSPPEKAMQTLFQVR